MPPAVNVEFFFDFSSPYSYLAAGRIESICRLRGASVDWRPILLGPIFKSIGKVPLFKRTSEGDYARRDLQRIALRLGIPFRFPPRFPVESLRASRGAFFARDHGAGAGYCRRVFEACWAGGRDIGDEGVLDEVVASMGLDAAAFREYVVRQDVKDALRTETARAAERGVFGAPTFFLGGEMFYGQDRLADLDSALLELSRNGQHPPGRFPTPFNAWFGIRCTRREPGSTEYELEVDDHLMNKKGVAHGGAVASLLDTAMGGAVVSAIRPEEWCATLELSIQFHEPVRKGRATGRGRMVRRGRSVAFVEGDVVDAAGRTLAVAQGTWYIWPRAPG